MLHVIGIILIGVITWGVIELIKYGIRKIKRKLS